MAFWNNKQVYWKVSTLQIILSLDFILFKKFYRILKSIRTINGSNLPTPSSFSLETVGDFLTIHFRLAIKKLCWINSHWTRLSNFFTLLISRKWANIGLIRWNLLQLNRRLCIVCFLYFIKYLIRPCWVKLSNDYEIHFRSKTFKPISGLNSYFIIDRIFHVSILKKKIEIKS